MLNTVDIVVTVNYTVEEDHLAVLSKLVVSYEAKSVALLSCDVVCAYCQLTAASYHIVIVTDLCKTEICLFYTVDIVVTVNYTIEEDHLAVCTEVIVTYEAVTVTLSGADVMCIGSCKSVTTDVIVRTINLN